MKNKNIRISFPKIEWDDLKDLKTVIKSGWLTNGPIVRKFEDRLNKYLGAEYLVACSSGTAALQIAIIACGIGPGDEVIIPDYTFPAVANAVEHSGAKPILSDIDLNSLNLDPNKLKDKLSKNTKAIIPVHQFGLPAEMDSLQDFAQKHNLTVIEDAACALGSEYQGKKCGTIGKAGCFSFHPRKIITTGEGGAVATNDRRIFNQCKLLRNHGISEIEHLNYQVCGYNFRMSDLNASIGLAQFRKVRNFLKSRGKFAGIYKEKLQEIKQVHLPQVPDYSKPSYQSFVILVDESFDRDLIIKKLKARGIETNSGAVAIHTLPYYQNKYGYRDGDLPNSHTTAKSSLCLPLFPQLKMKEIDFVVDSLKSLFKEKTILK